MLAFYLDCIIIYLVKARQEFFFSRGVGIEYKKEQTSYCFSLLCIVGVASCVLEPVGRVEPTIYLMLPDFFRARFHDQRTIDFRPYASVPRHA